MSAYRTLVRNNWTREPEEGRRILTVSQLRAFWTRHFMQVNLGDFHKAMMFVQAELAKIGEEAGFSYDETSKSSPELKRIIDGLAEDRLIGLEWNGAEKEIVFNADTGNRLLAILRGLDLEAEENKFLLPLGDQAVNFYNECRARKVGCDQ